MNKYVYAFLFLLCASYAHGQITITAADVPAAGDTLRYSVALATAAINLSDSGSNNTWNYTSLVPMAQAIDTYKTAAQVNATYAVTISPTAYGIKVADSIPGAPVPVKDIYNFFNKKTSPSRYVTVGFAAKLSGAPIPINYSDEDEIFYFPLTSTRPLDSSTFRLSYSIPGFGSFSQQGYRKTKVDGWGTIETPYTTAPVSVLRTRAEIVEIDSFTFGGTSMGIPRTTVEYKWLANGEHYPLLFVTAAKTGGTETPVSVRYRDKYRNLLGINPLSQTFQKLSVYPNPVSGAAVFVKVPASWIIYTLRVFDVTGKLISETSNTPKITTAALSAGKYIVIAESGVERGMSQFVK